MAPSNGVDSARTSGHQEANIKENQAVDLNQTKKSYAMTITTATPMPTPNMRHPRESVIARHTTHNGMPAVIFKVKDYYGSWRMNAD